MADIEFLPVCSNCGQIIYEIIDIKYLDNVNQMIKDFSGEVPMHNSQDCTVKIIKEYLYENDLKEVYYFYETNMEIVAQAHQCF